METETIIPFSFTGIDDDELLLGIVLGVDWSLLLSRERDERLKSIAVNRTPSTGKVDFEIHLKHTCMNEDEDPVTIDMLFVDSLEDGQKNTFFDLHQKLHGELKGHIILYEATEMIGRNNVPTHIKNLPTAFKHLCDNLSVMFNNPDFFPDASLVCGNTKFLGHRSILSARSPVLAKMMLESQGVVNIVDVEANALEFILKYIYSGKTDTLTEELAEDLLFAINMYQLQELKLICVQKLKLQTTVDNVARMLALGHLHDEGLMNYAEEFICEYDKFSEIENTNHWKVLEGRFQTLAFKVAKSALRRKEKYI